jgi:16S rRNA (guanine527-N7)-methyltransferase
MMLSIPRHGWRDRIEHVLSELVAPKNQRLSTDVVSRIERFLDLTVDWSRRMDLTAARDADELVDLTLADAAVVQRHSVVAEGDEWVDVGTGAGAPAIALAILEPRARFTLVEPRTKRVAFLRTVLGAIDRADVTVRRVRSDALLAASFDTAISRATLPPDQWLAEGCRLARHHVWVLLAKSRVPSIDGWHADIEVDYRWPLTGVARSAVRFIREWSDDAATA